MRHLKFPLKKSFSFSVIESKSFLIFESSVISLNQLYQLIRIDFGSFVKKVESRQIRLKMSFPHVGNPSLNQERFWTSQNDKIKKRSTYELINAHETTFQLNYE